mmetsp:Transcript_31449/g.73452  ORF Transcript_31449/g.73452 Transcript_31449/m.73452 type:complete len:646 (+) Transcript_31449:68-2005(+)
MGRIPSQTLEPLCPCPARSDVEQGGGGVPSSSESSPCAWVTHHELWNICRKGFDHWWQVTTSLDYLESPLGRRQARARLVPTIVALIGVGDVITFFYNPSIDSTSILALDAGVLVPAALLGRAAPGLSSLWPDCCLAAIAGLTFLGVATCLAEDLGVVMAYMLVCMVSSCAVGFHTLCSLSFLLVAMLLSWLQMSVASGSQALMMSVVTCTSCLFMDYIIASSHRHLQQRDAEKQRLLDLATDGSGTLCSQTRTFTSVSTKLLETLQRKEDLIGVPIEALVCTNDHAALGELLRPWCSPIGQSQSGSDPTPQQQPERQQPEQQLITFRTSAWEFDARLIVHAGSPAAASPAAVGGGTTAGQSKTKTLNFCIVVVGEPRRQVPVGAPGSAAASERSFASSAKCGAAGAGGSAARINNLLQLPPPLPKRSSRGSKRTSSRGSAAASESCESDMCEFAGAPRPPSLDTASLVEEIRTSAELRTVAVQTPARLSNSARRDQLGSDAAANSGSPQPSASAGGRSGGGGSTRRFRTLGQVEKARLQLEKFEPTPVTTRRQGLLQLVRSYNTGLPVRCCSMHASWSSLVEVIDCHLSLRCEKLEPPHSDWQCTKCKAMNERPEGEAVNLPTWQCKLCHEQVVPFLGRNRLAL